MASVVYISLITVVFVSFALLLLFPCNALFPLDRRLAGIFFSAVCTIILWTADPDAAANAPGDDIDIHVLIILAAIMAINFVIMRQPLLQAGISRMQQYIRNDRNKGFWFVSLVAFAASPFITNDGLCLLLVSPVLEAFDSSNRGRSSGHEEICAGNEGTSSMSPMHQSNISDPHRELPTIAIFLHVLKHLE